MPSGPLRDLGTAPVISYPLIVSKTLMVDTTCTRDDNTDVLVNPKTLVTNIPKGAWSTRAPWT